MAIAWPTATAAFLGPVRTTRRRSWSAQAVRPGCLVRAAARAASTRARRSHLLPLRVLAPLRLPALALLAGAIPAHDARWRAVGNGAIVSPISAASTSAVRRLA